MIREKWKALVQARREAQLVDATRREAGGSGTRLGIWLALAGVASLACMAFLGREASGAGALILAAIGALAWRDWRADDTKWGCPQKARQNRISAWVRARQAGAEREKAAMESASEKGRQGGGPKRL